MSLELLFYLYSRFRSESLFRRCRVEGASDIEVFEYEGLLYNKQRFIQLKAKELSSTRWKKLLAELTNLESGLVNTTQPDLELALMDAYKLAISRKKMPKAFR